MIFQKLLQIHGANYLHIPLHGGLHNLNTNVSEKSGLLQYALNGGDNYLIALLLFTCYKGIFPAFLYSLSLNISFSNYSKAGSLSIFFSKFEFWAEPLLFSPVHPNFCSKNVRKNISCREENLTCQISKKVSDHKAPKCLIQGCVFLN